MTNSPIRYPQIQTDVSLTTCLILPLLVVYSLLFAPMVILILIKEEQNKTSTPFSTFLSPAIGGTLINLLNELISSLLPSEVRFCQRLLKNMTFVRDFIPDLPVEIHLVITTFLGLRDLTSLRSVSKRWYDCWTQVSLCNKLMKERFRSAFENSYMNLPDYEKRLQFMATSDRFQALQSGNYDSMTTLNYHRHGDVPVPICRRRYSSGRVAWLIDEGITISELCSGDIRTYRMPDRDGVYFWALSENLVVVVNAFRAKIHAWQLDGGEYEYARLPSPPRNTIAIQGHRVGIVTTAHEIIIWDFGGSAFQMAIEDPIPGHRGFRDIKILFHPDSVETIFVIFLTYPKVIELFDVTGTVQWIVQKYTCSKLIATYKFEYPIGGLHYIVSGGPRPLFWLRSQKIDDYGIYNIGRVSVGYASESLDLGCHHHWDRSYRRHNYRCLAHYIIFNIYEERFSTSFYHLSRDVQDRDYIGYVTPTTVDPGEIATKHCWGGQLFVPLMKLIDSPTVADPHDEVPVKKALLMSIKSCDQIVGSSTDIRCIGGNRSTHVSWTTNGSPPTCDLGISYYWFEDCHLAQRDDIPIRHEGDDENYKTCEIYGDGTFVVLFRQYDYVVWCFDKKLRVRKQE